jgi:hypothetical protein
LDGIKEGNFMRRGEDREGMYKRTACCCWIMWMDAGFNPNSRCGFGSGDAIPS